MSFKNKRFTMVLNDETGAYDCVEISEGYRADAQPRIHVIEDTMTALEHPCDGRMYTSKSEFSRVTKAHGCVEVGQRPGDRRSANYESRSDALYRAFDRAWQETVQKP